MKVKTRPSGSARQLLRYLAALTCMAVLLPVNPLVHIVVCIAVHTVRGSAGDFPRGKQPHGSLQQGRESERIVHHLATHETNEYNEYPESDGDGGAPALRPASPCHVAGTL